MRREPKALTRGVFDLLVVGGGINGACIAHDAAGRGLTVALIEKGDFCGQTSANSLKIVHSGVRCLQGLDVAGARWFIRERSALLRIAPGLVVPLPVLVPAGTGLRSRPMLRAALAIHSGLGWDRNAGLPVESWSPAARTLSAHACESCFPELAGLVSRGAALWHDALVLQPERLVLAFVASAVANGAVAVNYVAAEKLLLAGGRVAGVLATDVLGGGSLEIRARVVVDAAGPWAWRLAETSGTRTYGRRWAAALNVVVSRRVCSVGFGLRSRATASEDPIGGGGRYLFFAPWRRSTLVGTRYRLADRAPGDEAPTFEEISDLLDECNAAWPGLDLLPSEVTNVHWGWLPLKSGREGGRPDALAENARVDDMADAVAPGLIVVSGVKLTTARGVAKRVTDAVFHHLGRRTPPSRTESAPLEQATLVHPQGSVEELEPSVRTAVQEEMAVTLADIVWRRTGLGTESCPSRSLLEGAACVMAELLGWDQERRRSEVEKVLAHYRPIEPAGSLLSSS